MISALIVDAYEAHYVGANVKRIGGRFTQG